MKPKIVSYLATHFLLLLVRKSFNPAHFQAMEIREADSVSVPSTILSAGMIARSLS